MSLPISRQLPAWVRPKKNAGCGYRHIGKPVIRIMMMVWERKAIEVLYRVRWKFCDAYRIARNMRYGFLCIAEDLFTERSIRLHVAAAQLDRTLDSASEDHRPDL